jgi:molecular chaperone DnaK (HSP70)
MSETMSETMSEAKFSVGIDLGTTHCVLAYAELNHDAEPNSPKVLSIGQLVAPGQVESLPALPSFLYLPHEAEFDTHQLQLPWHQAHSMIGNFARELGNKTPDRIISSAKSWLCQADVDRRSAFLPLDAPEDIQKFSPYQVSKSYIQHIQNAWQQQQPDSPLSEQQLVITVPASFEPSARDLTLDAAHECGLHNAILLEEPQAALYSWIAQNNSDWRQQVTLGDVILVVDIGGGTTDLSLIAVTEEEGALQLTRVAVGDHVLLGGDNMDLTLAHVVNRKLASQGTRLQPWQINGLTHACRAAKETLLADNDTQQVPLVVPSRGSSLMAGSLRSELTRDEVSQVLIEGFFPHVDSSAKVQKRAKAALSTISLPFENDPAITRHLASFLTRQQSALHNIAAVNVKAQASFVHPTAILFNGGVAKATGVTQRMLEVLNNWLQNEQASPVKVLQGIDLDQAVAKGASYYAQVRDGSGVRIRGGTAAAYYVGIESAMPAIPGMEPPIEAYCIAPFAMEEGTQAELPSQSFALTVGEPVQFRLFESKIRRDDQPGTRLDYWDEGEISELAPIEITLNAEHHQAGQVVSVQLQANINELGTLELRALEQQGEASWQINFDTRN